MTAETHHIQQVQQTNTINNNMNSTATATSLIDVYNNAVERLTSEEIYSKYSHDFTSDYNGKMRGKPPFRESKSGTSFTVYSDKGFFDAGDGFAGSPADYVHSLSVGRWEKAKGRDFFNAVKILCDQAGVTIPERELSQEEIEKAQQWERRRTLLSHAVEFNHSVLKSPDGDVARAYLNSRDINNDVINQLKIGYCHKSSDLFSHLQSIGFSDDEIKSSGVCQNKFDKYISFPWLDVNGKILTIYYRYSEKNPPEGKPKTYALHGEKTKSHPYLFDLVRKNNHRECIFVEGLFDAIGLQINGETRACSGIGASFSNDNINQLKRHRIERVYHIGDPDDGGDAGTESNLTRLLDEGIEVFIPERLPDGLDPDEYVKRDGIDALKQRIENAQHGLTWKAKQLISNHGNSDSDKIDLIKEAKKWIKSRKNLDSVIVELNYFSVLAQHLGISIEVFKDSEIKLSDSVSSSGSVSETEIKTEKSEITQEAYDYLYGDKNWICLNGVLYYFTGTYYKKSDDTEQRRRIANFLNHHPVSDNQGNIKYPYAKPNFVSQVLDWAKFLTGVSIDDCNPTGLNCLNGVLQIEWETTPPNLHPIPKAVLKPHSPDFYYLYEPVVTFNPNAKPDDCNRMLEVLEPEQQDIFLKTIGASLDIVTVRRYKGRSIKALLCKGHGANGKDTLREAVAGLFGYHGITGATLDDFAQYDSGRKFPLAKLIHSRVNWASENGNAASLDKLQSLKAAITGDSLSCEHKGVNESEFNPQSIFLFNINDVPRMGAALEAIKSRFAVLSFDKTYKVGADPSKGEIEADSRFKYDPEWVKQNVLPAFLNRVLHGLTDLMTNGIDYTSTEKALDDIRCQNGHLWQFASDTGLAYNPDATLSAQELWEALEAWYLNNGTLTQEDDGKGKVKNVWEEPLNKSDKLIKTKNHVIAGFLKIFPKASRVVIDSKNGKTGIKGLCFQPAGNSPGNLRVTSGYPVGYPNPYTEGLPGKSGNFSESTGNKKNIDDIPANNTLLGDTQPEQLEIVESIGKTYPTYPETIQQGDFDTRKVTRDLPATLPDTGDFTPPSDKPVTLKELVEAEPAPPMTYLAVVIPFESLQAGETIYDSEGKPHTLKQNPWGYYWLTDTGLQIDKSNINNFHRE